jgi:hypothetical protein
MCRRSFSRFGNLFERRWHGAQMGGKEPSGYNSYCTKCGAVARQNFTTRHQRIYAQCKGMDENANFGDEDEWDYYSLKKRYDLVKSFDKMVDDCIEIFKSICDNYRVIEMAVPCTRIVKVLEPIAAEA